MSNVITVNHLIKHYRKAKTNAVDDVSFNVEEGEFFALLGPNGAGKTTTISILNTTLAKTSGQMEVAGYNVDTQSSQVRQSIGVIFQNPSLDLNLTAEENVRFHAVLYGLYPYRPSFALMPSAYKRKVKELAEVLGITGQIYQPIKTFSGGMKRKLEIIRGLIHNPKVLFLDEPTTGLDPESRQNLWQYLMEVRKKQSTTIFLTTHYLEETEDSDRVCIINHGKVIALSTPHSLKKKFVDEYVVVDSHNREELQKELLKHTFQFEGNGPFKIPLQKNSAQEVVSALKTKLSVLQIHTPTLEEAYLEVIKEDHE